MMAATGEPTRESERLFPWLQDFGMPLERRALASLLSLSPLFWLAL